MDEEFMRPTASDSSCRCRPGRLLGRLTPSSSTTLVVSRPGPPWKVAGGASPPPKPQAISDGCSLDLYHLYHAIKCFGGYDGACESNRWDDIFHLINDKLQPWYVTECAKHVLVQLYYEHLYDYDEFTNKISWSQGNRKMCKNDRGIHPDDHLSVSISQGEGRNPPGSIKEMDDVEALGIRSSWKSRNQKGDRMATSEHHANNDGTTWKNVASAGAR